jgi:hypothetical protein
MLSAVPVHVSLAVKISPSILRAIDKLRRAFIWADSDQVHGGRCLVAWAKVTHPVELGGLGVTDLTKMGYALRLRWEWLAREDPDRSWALLPSKPENITQSMFAVSVSVAVGDGSCALFWTDNWIEGHSISQLAPMLSEAVSRRAHKTRLVHDAIP